MRDLGIGRTPLREAVKRLALENLVAVQPRSGTYVTGVDAADIVHIAEVRAELEAHAAELAARRIDGELRERAEALLEQVRALERSADAQALMGLDEAIHRLIWEASHNPYLIETLERYFVLSLRVWYVVLDRVPGLTTAVLDHAQPARGGARRRPGPRARADARARDRVRARDRRRVQPRVTSTVITATLRAVRVTGSPRGQAATLRGMLRIVVVVVIVAAALFGVRAWVRGQDYLDLGNSSRGPRPRRAR